MSSLFSKAFLVVSVAATAFSTPLSTSYNAFADVANPLTLAPLVADNHPHGTVNNSYIVVLKDGVTSSLKASHFNMVQQVHGSDPLVSSVFSGIRHVYEGRLNGYAGHFTEQVIEQIRKMPEVDFIEKDQIVRTTELEGNAPWGLARISHRKRLTFGSLSKYFYNPQGGEGVDVYVIDTGINIDHVEFQGRAIWGKTIPLNDVDEDGNGHGTHCAGTIASRKYGVAKRANVIAVKVLGSNGSGSMSDVIAGVDFASTSAQVKAAKAAAELAATGRTNHKGSVANMSLGGGKSRALDITVNNAVAAGLHFAVAAGNDNRDACDYSPAAAEDAVTVGASTLSDERAYFSNFGKCVDVFAPGLNILSTWTGSRTATAKISGTSMASPHTAGLLAYLLSIYPSADFDPTYDSYGQLISLESQQVLSTSFSSTSPSSLYAMAYRTLPMFISAHLPSPAALDIIFRQDQEAQTAPIPKTLSPAQLKKALLALSTPGALQGPLPDKTPNLLIFNNATIFY